MTPAPDLIVTTEIAASDRAAAMAAADRLRFEVCRAFLGRAELGREMTRNGAPAAPGVWSITLRLPGGGPMIDPRYGLVAIGLPRGWTAQQEQQGRAA